MKFFRNGLSEYCARPVSEGEGGYVQYLSRLRLSILLFFSEG